MKGRGMSQIITTVIMIGIVLVAVGAVWVVAQNILSEGLEDVSLGSLKVNLDIENVKVTDTGLDVKVKRNSGEANLVGINFIVSDGENTQVFEEETDMKELATQTFSLDYEGVVESVEIAPVLANDDGKEKVYDVINKYEDFSIKDNLVSLGAVSWWKMDGDGHDEIGKNNGELIGDVDCNIRGVYGKACKFDGSGNYIAVENDETLNFVDELSFEVYIYPESLDKACLTMSNWIGVFSKVQAGGYGLWIGGAWNNWINDLNFLIYNNTDSYIKTNFSINELKLNQWQNVVGTYKDGEMKIYLNDVLISEKNVSGSIAINNLDLIIGGELDVQNQGICLYKGIIDELILFDKALTEEEVNWLYEQDLS